MEYERVENNFMVKYPCYARETPLFIVYEMYAWNNGLKRSKIVTKQWSVVAVKISDIIQAERRRKWIMLRLLIESNEILKARM